MLQGLSEDPRKHSGATLTLSWHFSVRFARYLAPGALHLSLAYRILSKSAVGFGVHRAHGVRGNPRKNEKVLLPLPIHARVAQWRFSYGTISKLRHR